MRRKNPSGMSGTEIALILGGVVAVGVVGYLIWNSSQSTAGTASSGSGTATTPVLGGDNATPGLTASDVADQIAAANVTSSTVASAGSLFPPDGLAG
jgi:hypothetical protein